MKFAWILALTALPLAACTFDNPAFGPDADTKADDAGTGDTDTGKQETGDAGVETGDGDTSTTTTGDGDTSTTTTGDGDTTGMAESSTDTGMAESSTDTGMAESSTDTGPLDTSDSGDVDTGGLLLCEGLGPDLCASTDGCKSIVLVDIHETEPESYCWGSEVFLCLEAESCGDAGPYLCNGQYPNLIKLVEGGCTPPLPLGWETCPGDSPQPDGPC